MKLFIHVHVFCFFGVFFFFWGGGGGVCFCILLNVYRATHSYSALFNLYFQLFLQNEVDLKLTHRRLPLIIF